MFYGQTCKSTFLKVLLLLFFVLGARLFWNFIQKLWILFYMCRYGISRRCYEYISEKSLINWFHCDVDFTSRHCLVVYCLINLIIGNMDIWILGKSQISHSDTNKYLETRKTKISIYQVFILVDKICCILCINAKIMTR